MALRHAMLQMLLFFYTPPILPEKNRKHRPNAHAQTGAVYAFMCVDNIHDACHRQPAQTQAIEPLSFDDETNTQWIEHTHKAGRRGGESTARAGLCRDFFTGNSGKGLGQPLGGGCAVAAARKFSMQALWAAGKKRAGFPAGVCPVFAISPRCYTN